MLIVARICSILSNSKVREMNEHEFTLILTTDRTEEQADKLYGVFNDGTISTIAGVPQIHFHREAGSTAGEESAVHGQLARHRRHVFERRIDERD